MQTAQNDAYKPILGVEKGAEEILTVARANRHFIPDQIWHLTHRCHKREFLLKFARDRQRWLHRIDQALKGKARGRKMRQTMDGWELREVEMLYNADFGGENGAIEGRNLHFWMVKDTISGR